MPKATTLSETARPGAAAGGGEALEQIQAGFSTVAGSMTQIRVHERMLQAAGVRLDRAGSALLYKLSTHGDSLRVTDLAELLGVDAPTVTRKIQQLERQELVSRHPDPDDGRATRIRLTRSGQQTLERVLQAKREWFEHLVDGWDPAELATFASLLGRFATALQHDLEDARVA